MKLAAEGGYEAVQMRRVAESSGVALGTIYRYFNSKDEMLLAGLAGWTAQVTDELTAEPAEGSTSAERLAGLLCAASARLDAAPVLMGALVTAMSSTGADVARFRERIQGGLRAIIVHAIGDDVDAKRLEAAQRIVGHVWFSAINQWVSGQAPHGSVCEELRFTAHALLD